MGKLTPIFGVLGLLGFAALHACSSDDGASGGKKGGGGGGSGGDGGDAGAPPLGGSSGNTSGGGGSGATGGDTPTGGRGGTGGTGDNGGAAGQAGEPTTGGVSGDAGSGGEGGEGAVGPGADCTTCINGGAADSARVTLLEQCTESPPCAAWMTCVRGCSDSACLDACDSANSGVAPYRYAIYGALCDACDTQCNVFDLCARSCTDNVNLPIQTTAPATLAETGLYTAATAVAPYVRAFHPEYELWSDGAAKQRWAYIPRCSRINTAGINHWIFPVGTRMWKEFSVAPTAGGAPVRVETRMLQKFGPNDADWVFATYQWPMNNANPTAAEATLVTTGVTNANGTAHDIPAVSACPTCHAPLVERVLGFGAIQLSHNQAGVTIRELADGGWLTFTTTPLAPGWQARDGWDPPGMEADQRALGYLHANCGNCHHENSTFGGTTPAKMRLTVGNMTVASTNAVMSLVNVPTVRAQFVGCDRIEPGFPQFSEIVMRMGRRDVPLPGLQMPPLATEQVHSAALDQIKAWIMAMPNAGTVPTTCTAPP